MSALDLRARASEVRDFLPHAAEVVRGVRPLPEPLVACSSPRARAEWLRRAKEVDLS